MTGSLITWSLTLLMAVNASAKLPEESTFEREIKPILAQYCFGCHADGASEGSMSFDQLLAETDREATNERWYRVLKQLQSGLMPPAGEDRPDDEELKRIEDWIKHVAFDLNPRQPDPGRITIRRLNQVEYRNTIRELLGVDFDTASQFPADDTGHGFDNISDVLSISPLLFEKYVNAAKEIVSEAVPVVPGIVRVQRVAGDQFVIDPVKEEAANRESSDENNRQASSPSAEPGTIDLSYYTAATARAKLAVPFDGDYIVRLTIKANETYVDNQFDENKCEFTFSLGDKELLRQTFVRQGGKEFSFDFNQTFTTGEYDLVASVTPLTDTRQIRSLRIQISSVDLIGPDEPKHHVKPEGYEKFFPRDVPESLEERRDYARTLLRDFSTRAFRRPVEEANLDQLVELAESVSIDGGGTFEAGIAKSMTAILASPQFLFREEVVISPLEGEKYPQIDEYSLASRLSYFLWSSMPDDELMQLAGDGMLRSNLDQQVARMLQDDKSSAFFENFVGQWLRARAVDTVQINSQAVLQREPRAIDPDAEARRKRFFELFRKDENRNESEEQEFEDIREVIRRNSRRRGPRFSLTPETRTAMRRETEMLFEHIVRDDRSLLELIDSDYTFLNEELAGHYQIEGLERVQGNEMRLVSLPANSPRGGILTQGTVLTVTSNPDRTSPVKCGLFVLENLLGTPTPAPPPNIPTLEDVKAHGNEDLSLRQTLALHRQNTLCSSCHNRMDPLGLALENFNAIGRFRTEELGQAIDTTGVLSTGESFSTISELKSILVTQRKRDLYRCMTEKLMTYALGRAVEYTDAHTVDELVALLEATDGRPSSLIYGIIHSSAFQRTRD